MTSCSTVICSMIAYLPYLAAATSAGACRAWHKGGTPPGGCSHGMGPDACGKQPMSSVGHQRSSTVENFSPAKAPGAITLQVWHVHGPTVAALKCRQLTPGATLCELLLGGQLPLKLQLLLLPYSPGPLLPAAPAGT